MIYELRVYNDGLSIDQNNGESTMRDCSTSVLPDGSRENGVSTVATSFPAESWITDLNSTFLETDKAFSTEVLTEIVADDTSTFGVVIYVPHWAI